MRVYAQERFGSQESARVALAAALAAGLWIALAASEAAAGRRKETARPAKALPVGPVEVKRDFRDGYSDIEKLLRAKDLPKEYAQAVRPAMYKLASDRTPVDVIVRRVEGLLASLAGRVDLSAERKQLAALKDEADVLRAVDKSPDRELYAKFSQLYWQIAKKSPALAFDKILFIKRYPSARSHMVDQFLGRNARPGGGIYILADAFSDKPTVIDVLAKSVVQNGRLKGRKLAGGCFLAPDLSYDGKTIVFAYCECGKADSTFRPGWGDETCFHLFRVNVDGSDLRQLTDGPWNDFDPCWLPNGRLAFISERRGGYGRCHGGRDAPSYTLSSCLPDGSDISFLSYHESNEWQPSVTPDGMLVFTRWDYVDRGTNQAHHPWISTIDGRDARAIHGNYPNGRNGLHLRPWMEMDLRAIPGTRTFVATAGAHHGQAYGSLVILDADRDDDNAMSQLRRLTPDERFPEAERGGRTYATAWPLSQDQFLCARNGDLYLIDTFGQRYMLYDSRDVPCLSPIPLRARPMPPRMPDQMATAEPAPARPAAGQTPSGAFGTIAVTNVYNGQLPWPKGTKITALRIVQIIPKPSNRTRGFCGTGRTNMRDVVGTVGVEADGSAYFYAPANESLYFQALDERGMAVQSMRSDTWVHPGERLACRGCHEPQNSAPPHTGTMPLALRRQPSQIRPGPEGSRPMSFAKLAQPVFDAKCNECHKRKKARKMDRSTAMKLVPYYVSPKPYEPSLTVPGTFGARGSKLLKYLQPSHYDVKLTPDEFARLATWMDCNCADQGSQQIKTENRLRLAEFRGTDFEKNPR